MGTSWLFQNEVEKFNSGPPGRTKSSLLQERGFEPGTSRFQIQPINHSDAPPPLSWQSNSRSFYAKLVNNLWTYDNETLHQTTFGPGRTLVGKRKPLSITLPLVGKGKLAKCEDCPRSCTYLVAEASIRDLTYCPQQAKNCSVYSEWNCLRTVIIPTTNGALSIWSVGRLATIVPGAREQVLLYIWTL